MKNLMVIVVMVGLYLNWFTFETATDFILFIIAVWGMMTTGDFSDDCVRKVKRNRMVK